MTKVIRLHDYQADIVLRLRQEWQVCRSVMVQMPTGTGKTHVLAAVVSEELRKKRQEKSCWVWIIVHRRELVAQIEETVERYGISLADGRVRVMSIQWLTRHWKDMEEEPGLIVIDEAHHAQAKTYRMLWEKCPNARFLGLTATPCRMNHSGFTGLFDSLVCSWSIAKFIMKGRLSLFDYVSIRPDSEERRLIDSLEKRGADGDYQVREMNAVLNRRPGIERLYRSVMEFAGGRKGIVYAVSIDHARSIAEYYCEKGLDAVAIDSRTPARERKRMVEDFKAGKIRVLVNVDVFSEGFDCPDVEFVQMARPTLSLAKYLQQAGRGLRKAEGKETCVLIDNVGLYRVFGLPTVAWDWEAMFRGDMAGKGAPSARHGDVKPHATTEETREDDCGLEKVVSHECLSEAIASQKVPCPSKTPGLKAWRDRESGLWGLCRGRQHITEAVYTTVFDIRHDIAAVRFTDNRCGMVDTSGGTMWTVRDCQSMKFTRNHILIMQKQGGRFEYTDLYSLQTYRERPMVKRFGDVEMLKVGSAYYSRTKKTYVNSHSQCEDCIFFKDFYLSIIDYGNSSAFRTMYSYTDRQSYGYVCLLANDHDSYYWIHSWLADGSIIVMDGNSKFWHVEDGGGKRYVGCCDYEEKEKCLMEIARITKRAEEIRKRMDEEKLEKRRMLLDMADEATPFRSGMKWGLKVGERITIPPTYRNVRPPIGKYCAVEKNYSQWGVIAVDGTVMVEPQYSDIEIGAGGNVIGTKVSGDRVSMKLP